MRSKPIERFTGKVGNYIKYRPGYPNEVLEYLQSAGDLPAAATIADIGSGTGIFTKLLLDAGYKVYAVEPNAGMRQAAEASLGKYPGFVSVNGAGEQTTLQSDLADMIVSATAFHWIDAAKAKVEFIRISKPSAKVALIWNIRKPDADEFSVAYEEFWKSYDNSEKSVIKDFELKNFYTDGKYETRFFDHYQEFDLEGLTGRSFSSSLSPAEGTEEGIQFALELKELFNRYQQNNKVRIHYAAKVYIGVVDQQRAI